MRLGISLNKMAIKILWDKKFIRKNIYTVYWRIRVLLLFLYCICYCGFLLLSRLEQQKSCRSFYFTDKMYAQNK